MDPIREWFAAHVDPSLARAAIGGGIEGLGWYVILAGLIGTLYSTFGG